MAHQAPVSAPGIPHGADEENRTPITCLEGRYSAVELHPQSDTPGIEPGPPRAWLRLADNLPLSVLPVTLRVSSRLRS